MSTFMSVTLILGIFLILLFVLYKMQQRHMSFGKRVMTGLVLGIVLGAAMNALAGGSPGAIKDANSWIDVVGSGYVRLLKMIVMPLIMVSITSAITNLKDVKTLGKAGGLIIGILMLTTAVAATIGAGSSAAFHLSAEGMQMGEQETGAKKNLEGKLTSFQAKSIQQQLIEIIPTNPFYSMTGQGSTDTLSIVFFSAFIGIAVLGIKKKKPETAEFFIKLVDSLHDVVMRVVTLVLRLTPFGVLALMAKFVSTSKYSDIVTLLQFVMASYVALILMFIVHLLILAFMGLNPVKYVQKIMPVMAFAFTSRTSAGTLPLTIQTLINKLGVPEGYANLAGSFGTSIGQNGCAGIYPAMLTIMIAPTVGINPLEIGFFVKMILIVALGSFGIAGVGGGATFAALVVLSTLGLPVGLVGLLIAIEPLIDMGRTALNVSGAMVAGVATSRVMGELNSDAYNQMTEEEVFD